MIRTTPTVLLVLALAVTGPAGAADLIVSANDGKMVRVDGVMTYPSPPVSDSLAVIDGAVFPPAVKYVLGGIAHTVQGPPQAVAVTSDGRLAIVGAPSRYDYKAKKEIFGNYLQFVALDGTPRLIGQVALPGHPNGLAINRQGTLLLAASVDGSLYVLSIAGDKVQLTDRIKLSNGRLASVSFTHDGKAALVSLRDEGSVAVLDVRDSKLTPTAQRISTGLAPYGIDVSGDGRWGVVGNAGINGQNHPGNIADADSVTLIDLAHRPFRAVQYLTVPSTPEGVALSPDGRWLAVQAMDGSNLPPGNPGRRRIGKVLLFALDAQGARLVDALPGGAASQGLVFTADSKTILVQFDVERALAVYAVRNGRLADTGLRLKLPAGPVSIRAMPR
jgi:DNA-binding beta-propeller fold protein YncE